MSGLRITHPSASSAIYTLVDGKRKYRKPLECWTCARTHVFKTYHITLDGNGAGIVSHEIWAKLKKIPGQPFSLSNEVAKPPAQVIGMAMRADLPAVVAHKE
jgi:hypothetical protein